MDGAAGARLLAAAAAFVAAQPGGVGRLLSLHRPMSNGLCRAHAIPVRWPCGTVSIAGAAQELRARRCDGSAVRPSLPQTRRTANS